MLDFNYILINSIFKTNITTFSNIKRIIMKQFTFKYLFSYAFYHKNEFVDCFDLWTFSHVLDLSPRSNNHVPHPRS